MIWLSLRAVSLHSSPAICVNLILSASPLSICFLFYFLSPLGMSIFVIIIFSPCAFVLFSSFFYPLFIIYSLHWQSFLYLDSYLFFFGLFICLICRFSISLSILVSGSWSNVWVHCHSCTVLRTLSCLKTKLAQQLF